MTLNGRQVLVRLKGGMGNQLFQYCFALSLADGNPQNVLCLLDYFRSDSRHGGFALGQLLGPEIPVTESPPSGRRWAYVNTDLLADANQGFLRDSEVDLFVDGYFQHFANFQPVLAKVRSMFHSRFDQALYGEKLRILLDQPAAAPVVGIHLRRGDFLDPGVRQAHGIPSVDSMLDCLAHIPAEGYGAAVFSDSPVAIDLPCRAVHLCGDGPRSLASDIDQFRLMACCDWIVASNSTFSYWAGLLSSRAQKLFIPDPWMRSGSVGTQSLLTHGVQAYRTELL